MEAALLSLKDVCGIKGRGKTENISANGRSFTLIDESYNASPVSMRAALEVLGETPLKEGGRRIAVLGDMLELGRQTMAFHEGLEQSLQSNAIDLVFLSGKRMASLWNILPAEIRGHYEKEVKQLAPIVISQIRAGDVIMVKGSLGSNIGNIVLNIKKHFRISKH